MVFDYKKEYREFYLPPQKPNLVHVPAIRYAAVRGMGDPNEPEGEYKKAIGLLYAVTFTIKMSYKGSHPIEGYFPYVVPPLEGLWWQEGCKEIDYRHKEDFQWISMIRLPEFVTREVFEWAIREVERRKNMDCSGVEFYLYQEGLCVQCMHIGRYDEEPLTILNMKKYMAEQGYKSDISDRRFHHEIYLSDPRRCSPERLKTVIRHPIQPDRERTEPVL